MSHSTPEEIEAEAGEDWDYIVAEPDRLATYVRLVAITRARQEGKTPDHYTARTVCRAVRRGANIRGCARECGGLPVVPPG